MAIIEEEFSEFLKEVSDFLNSEDLGESFDDVFETNLIAEESSSKRRLSEADNQHFANNATKKQASTDPNPLVKRYTQFLYDLSKFFNKGDLPKISKLCDEYIDENCVFHFSRPILNEPKIGRQSVVDYFDMILQAYPDGIILLRDISLFECENKEFIRCKTIFTGTRTQEESINKYFNRPSRSYAEMIDTTKTTPEDFEYFVKLEKELSESGKHMMVYMKGRFSLEVNENRIVSLESTARLSSLRSVDD